LYQWRDWHLGHRSGGRGVRWNQTWPQVGLKQRSWLGAGPVANMGSVVMGGELDIGPLIRRGARSWGARRRPAS